MLLSFLSFLWTIILITADILGGDISLTHVSETIWLKSD